MISYVVALLAFGLFFFNPIARLLFPDSSGSSASSFSSHPISRRTPRPRLNEDLLALELPNDTALDCPPDAYSVRILSKEPLVMYIENFLTAEERSHLLEISAPLFEPSTVTDDGGAHARADPRVRLSSVALVPRTPSVRCVESRARALQGWRDDLWVERLRTQLYEGPGGHYGHHFDWSSNAGGWGRVSSMMVWVAEEGELQEGTGMERAGEWTGKVEGGGTEFPLLRLQGDKGRWCDFIECGGVEGEGKAGGKESGQAGAAGTGAEVGAAVGEKSIKGGLGEDEVGVTFKVRPGNAVYWENFRADGTGRGYEETWHAGLPVTRGKKVGLNIWSWGRIG